MGFFFFYRAVETERGVSLQQKSSCHADCTDTASAIWFCFVLEVSLCFFFFVVCSAGAQLAPSQLEEMMATFLARMLSSETENYALATRGGRCAVMRVAVISRHLFPPPSVSSGHLYCAKASAPFLRKHSGPRAAFFKMVVFLARLKTEHYGLPFDSSTGQKDNNSGTASLGRRNISKLLDLYRLRKCALKTIFWRKYTNTARAIAWTSRGGGILRSLTVTTDSSR